MAGRGDRSFWVSIALACLGFGLDRVHKFLQIDPRCLAWSQGLCPGGLLAGPGTGWQGGEFVRVTGFFDYVLVWNPGVSYGLFAGAPAALLGLLLATAIVGLGIWWWLTDAPLVRAGLGLAIGGALSNALDRGLYGAVADFFHFHWGRYSFYVFNLADLAITVGVVLLMLDLVLDRRGKKH